LQRPARTQYPRGNAVFVPLPRYAANCMESIKMGEFNVILSGQSKESIQDLDDLFLARSTG